MGESSVVPSHENPFKDFKEESVSLRLRTITSPSLDDQAVMATNVSEQISKLQLTLQAPIAANSTVSVPPPAMVSGYLSLQKNTGAWKKWWCEFYNGMLTYRREIGSKSVSGRIPVSFCEAEFIHERYMPETKAVAKSPSATSLKPFSLSRSTSNSTPATQSANAASPVPLLPVADRRSTLSGPPDVGKFDDLYHLCLGTASLYVFKVFSPARTCVFRADTSAVRDEFCNAIFEWLRLYLDETAFRRKVDALKELNPIIREQFMLHDSQYNQLVQTLAKTGFMEDELPITSTRKEKCGVLSMEVVNEGLDWKDYYFVLFEGTLFYYKDSKSTAPTGFLTLKYASVNLNVIGLTKGDFKFEVRTPLRTVACRAKHAVALAEWIASLDAALSVHMKKKGTSKRSSMEVLNDINRLIGQVATFRTLQTFPHLFLAFKEFLGASSALQLDFVLRVDKLKNSSASKVEKEVEANAILRQFIISNQSQSVVPLPPALLSALRQASVSVEMFDEAVQCCEKFLSASFAGFKETNIFQEMSFFGDSPQPSSGVAQSPTRPQPPPLVANTVKFFLVKVKGSKKSVEVKLSPKKDVLTIGRDKSNLLVVEDSRVSRSHARVEYNDAQCEYIDLGSSCGSKLNGKPVLRARLQPGDVLEIGQSTLIFQVAIKKPRFAFLGTFPKGLGEL